MAAQAAAAPLVLVLLVLLVLRGLRAHLAQPAALLFLLLPALLQPQAAHSAEQLLEPDPLGPPDPLDPVLLVGPVLRAGPAHPADSADSVHLLHRQDRLFSPAFMCTCSMVKRRIPHRHRRRLPQVDSADSGRLLAVVPVVPERLQPRGLLLPAQRQAGRQHLLQPGAVEASK